ncbi:manganese efflux pump MntP family protein [Phosphitispora sp. TUW77]|uniref:manganese efflux pump MntP n=1 Tax=Phosphitispora sp. TUW77 TaxID=3152361 RepID=UPI003AB13205
MGLGTIFALALALSADAFSFSLGLGMAGVNKRQVYLISLTVLIFHIVMPLAGYFAGGFVGSFLGRWAGYVGAAVLIALGLRMVWEGFSENQEENFSQYILTSIYGIAVLGLTVSIDALSVGFTLGTYQAEVGLAAAIIGLVSGIMAFFGLEFGKKVGEWMGRRALVAGGSVLVLIGIKMFV